MSILMAPGVFPPASPTRIAQNLDLSIDPKRDYGASGSSQSTTGSITAGQNILTLASAIDFKNGQGIAIMHAGPGPYQFGTTTPLGTPGAPTVTPTGTPGTTTYKYYAVALDALGGVTAASAVSQTTTGNATLNGTNYNALSLAAVTGATGYAWYGDASNPASSRGLLGITGSASFNDKGAGPITAPPWLPSTAPASALGEWLETTISSGAGTTTLTLAANATASAPSQNILHSDTTALSNWLGSTGQREFILPAGDYNVFSQLSVPTNGFAKVIGFGTAGGAAVGGSTIHFFGTGYAIKGSSLKWLTLDGFSIDFTSALPGANGIYLNGCWLSAIRRMSLTNFPAAQGGNPMALLIDTQGTSWGAQHIDIELLECPNAQVSLSGYNSSNQVTTTTLKTVRGMAYSFNYCGAVTCINATAEVFPSTGYSISNCNAFTMIGCDIEGSGTTGISIGPAVDTFIALNTNWAGFTGTTRLTGSATNRMLVLDPQITIAQTLQAAPTFFSLAATQNTISTTAVSVGSGPSVIANNTSLRVQAVIAARCITAGDHVKVWIYRTTGSIPAAGGAPAGGDTIVWGPFSRQESGASNLITLVADLIDSGLTIGTTYRYYIAFAATEGVQVVIDGNDGGLVNSTTMQVTQV